ncbi:Mucin-associated surface protein (MASP) [Trypanosoma cruzi]|uniref:Mucin-associated surface protein (MASP), putative n=2 Tax=Trypanosoma cruzi TaxID=5693 RepID=Q4CS52_TRYCC|nr:mucin-associated surface protein (MASP), putative [Trypanosoma cruzi]EAN83104.1 mucin-associated surface protein (MASP), putative [Trypanosoma cruzi]PWV15292.1 Mucin-associated surface protein (MASP) [Trypanosoma cruzi]|eukprot:XP_804955.1 mucin-associated surface protein (MASP) [Trypanosoma cruzi strain CL Brener]
MAMVMAGRVLLVCVLCVLCCGAGGVYARELDNKALGGYMALRGFGRNTSFLSNGSIKKLSTPLLLSASFISAMQAEAREEDVPSARVTDSPLSGATGLGTVPHVPGGPPAAEGKSLGPPSVSHSSRNTGGSSGNVGSVPSTTQNKSPEEIPLQEQTGTEQNFLSPEKKAADEKIDGAQIQDYSSALRQGVDDAATLDGEGINSLEETKNEKEDIKTPEAEESLEDPTKKLQGGETDPPASSTEKKPEPQPPHRTKNPATEENDSKNTDASTALPNTGQEDNPKKRRTEGPLHEAGTVQSTSTGIQEQTPAAAPNENPSSLPKEQSTVTQTTTNAQPLDSVQTKKRQSGDKKKLDNSDSSTAVSHTTSPLLLLLVVVCAAAAAVVAA